MKRSIMTEKIARRGYHIYREYGVDPLERHHVDEVMTRDVLTIDAATPLSDALAKHFGPQQVHRAYPVVRDGVLVGMLDRASLGTLIEASSVQQAGVSIGDALQDLKHGAPAFALPGEPCRLAATRLAVHELERLPVVADKQSLRLVGIVSRSDLVKPSRAHFDEEHRRERFRGFRRTTPVLKKH
jgi:CBS domain-containing protein